MKTEAQIDAIMEAIPQEWRARWCGGERGPCACMGCVQIGNRAVILEKITGRRFDGDPEYIREPILQEHSAVYNEYKLSREEWESWIKRRADAQWARVTNFANLLEIK